MRGPSNPRGPRPDKTDEELAALCAQGIDNVERELLQRYMQAIYWLPRQAFGVPEEDLSDFLLYAIEKIRSRDILAKYDPTRGARFSTWFGVILRNLFLDYTRSHRPGPASLELDESLPAPAEPDPPEAEDELLKAMQTRCRVLFKLLLCNTYLLTPEEIRWIAEQSKRSVLDVTRRIAAMEEGLADKEARLRQRYDKLATACWWKSNYEKQVRRIERTTEHPWTKPPEDLGKACDRLERRRQEYDRLVHELSGTAGIATAPYRELAKLLAVPDGTIASHISRCRTQASDFMQKFSQQSDRGPKGEGDKT